MNGFMKLYFADRIATTDVHESSWRTSVDSFILGKCSIFGDGGVVREVLEINFLPV